MADPIAILSQLTTLTFNAVAVGGIESISDIGSGTATKINTTTLASTVKESKQGLQDFGSFTINFSRRNQDDLGQVELATALAAQATHSVVITLTASTSNVITFSAYVEQLTTSINADGVVVGKAVLCVVSAPIYS